MWAEGRLWPFEQTLGSQKRQLSGSKGELFLRISWCFGGVGVLASYCIATRVQTLLAQRLAFKA